MRRFELLLCCALLGCAARVDDASDEAVRTEEGPLSERAGRIAWTRTLPDLWTGPSAPGVVADRRGYAWVITADYLAAYDPYGEIAWNSTLPAGGLDGRAIALAADGNLLIAGDFVAHAGCRQRNGEFVVMKRALDGTCLWIQSRPYPRTDDRALKMGVDGRGRIVLARHVVGPTGGRDLHVQQLDEHGYPVWARTFPDPQMPTRRSPRWFHALAVDAEGEIFLVGAFRGTAHFGSEVVVGAPPVAETTTFGTAFVVRMSPDGGVRGVHRIGDEAVATAAAIHEGRLAIAGRFRGAIGFGTRIAHNASPSADGFVASIDARTFVGRWLRHFGGTARQDLVAIAFDRNGRLNVTGAFRSPTDAPSDGDDATRPRSIQIPPYRFQTTSIEGRKIFVTRLAPKTGSTIWARTVLDRAETPHPSGFWGDPTALAVTPNNDRLILVGDWHGARPPITDDEDRTFVMRIYPY
jgi:hypothetical protein